MEVLKPKRGEVWWVNFDPSLGSEIQKVRPAVVISNNISNKYLDRFQVIPITSQIDKIYPGEALISLGKKQGKVMANQMTTVSLLRMDKKLITISKRDLLAVEQAVKLQIDLL